jgi:hypothetical protein
MRRGTRPGPSSITAWLTAGSASFPRRWANLLLWMHFADTIESICSLCPGVVGLAPLPCSKYVMCSSKIKMVWFLIEYVLTAVQPVPPYERPALTKGYLFPPDKKPARLPVSMPTDLQ